MVAGYQYLLGGAGQREVTGIGYLSPGWSWTEGRDGRRVAIPSGGSWTESKDGRRIAIPNRPYSVDFPNGIRVTIFPNDDEMLISCEEGIVRIQY